MGLSTTLDVSWIDEILKAFCRARLQFRAISWGPFFAVQPLVLIAADGRVEESGSIDLADIRSAVEGSEDAYRGLVERHQQAIGDYLWKFTHHRSDWDELLQVVFIEAYVNLRKFRGDGSFASWLRGIATHVGYRFWTDRKRQRRRMVPLTSETASVLTKESATGLGLFELFEHLSPRDRLVLTLIYIDGQSVAEAAQLTGWSESSIKVQAHRARARIKALWDQYHAE